MLSSTLEGGIWIVDESNSSMWSWGSGFNGTVSAVVDGESASETSAIGSGFLQ